MTKTTSRNAKRKTKLLLLDLDDTIMFNNSALSTAAKELTGRFLPRSEVRKLRSKIKRPIYDLAATKYTYLMTPNDPMLKIIKSNIGQNRVVILTARADSVRQNTLDLLSRHNVSFDELIMREEEFLEEDDEVWKADKIEKILETEHHPEVELYEDKIDNIEYFMRQFDRAHINYFHVTPGGITSVAR